jgi:hypothetical protein
MSKAVKTVTKAQAEAVFKKFKAKYDLWDTSEASLVYDWLEGHPAICWEGGQDDWAIEWDNDVKGTFCEPYYSFVLVIYPEW